MAASGSASVLKTMSLCRFVLLSVMSKSFLTTRSRSCQYLFDLRAVWMTFQDSHGELVSLNAFVKTCTSRNVNTVTKLAAMARALADN